jgi:hypothetical protein
MSLEAQMFAARGEYDAAFKDYSDVVRFSSESSQGAVFIGQLVGYAVQNIAAEGVSDLLRTGEYGDLQSFATVLNDVETNRQTAAQSVAIEAESFSNWFHATFATPESFYAFLSGEDNGVGEEINRLVANTAPATLYAQMEDAMALYVASSAYMELPFYEIQQLDFDAMYEGNPIAEALLLSVPNAAIAEARATARLDSLQIMTALESYRRDEGSYPGSIAELSPRFLSQTPLDPFTGEPYRYQQNSDTYHLYSTGPDQIDDGGVNDDWHSTGGDLVFVR